MTTAADSNVRPGRRSPAATARGARRFALARLLLQLFPPLQLYRKLFLLLAVPLMPACIIPFGPEFKDPDGVANSPPFVVSVFPAPGTKVVSSADTFTFRVTAADNDATDPLWVKWATEYPPYTTNTKPQAKKPLQRLGPGTFKEDAFPVGCMYLASSVTIHQIMVAISDGEFVEDDPQILEKVPAGAHTIILNWTWEKSCLATQ